MVSGSRQPLIVGNWKMNGLHNDSLVRVENILQSTNEILDTPVDLLICPPTTLLAPIAEMIKGSNVNLGGQDCHQETFGAHTGDISALMLADAGCSHVIVGHSERRSDYKETNEMICKKGSAGLAAELTIIICIGETKIEREKGQANDVILTQLSASLPKQSNWGNTIIAYEPIWAIGTGLTPNKKEIQDTHSRIRKSLSEIFTKPDAEKFRLLYGGSVKPNNAQEILSLTDVDGALVGGASLNWQDFVSIARCCS